MLVCDYILDAFLKKSPNANNGGACVRALHEWSVVQAWREVGVVCKRGGELKHWMHCGGSSVHVHESFAFYTLSALSRNSAGGTRSGDDWSGVFGMG